MSAEASLAAAGVTGGGARALLALMAAGGAAGEALARLIEDADAARALALSSGAEAAAARAEADESGTLLRGAERELERARGEIESLVSNGVALAGEYRGEAERARSSANALYCPRSESSEGARNRPGGTGEGLRLCEYFEAMAAPGDDAATGEAAFAEMGEAELALLPDDARAEVERARAAELEALEGRREADALLASVIGRDRAGDGDGGGKGAARRRRAASPPLAERFAGLEQRWVLALPDGGTAEFATRGEAEAAAAEAASALGDVGLRPMSIEERTELVLVPARVVAEHTLRPKYRARVRASSDLEAKELVSARVVRAQLAALRVSGLARARILAAGAPAAPDGRAAARRDVFLSTEARPALVRGSYVSPSLGAALCAALVCGSLPVWRQLSMPWPFCGADVPPSVAARWVNELYEKKLRHLMEPLGGRLLAGDVVHADETPIRVLRVGKGKSKSYMWLFSTPAGERFAVRLFCHAPDRRGSNAVEVLGDFAGWLVTDAYPGYNLLEAAMHAFCLLCKYLHKRHYDNTDVMTTSAAQPEVAGGAPTPPVDITRAVPRPLRRSRPGSGRPSRRGRTAARTRPRARRCAA